MLIVAHAIIVTAWRGTRAMEMMYYHIVSYAFFGRPAVSLPRGRLLPKGFYPLRYAGRTIRGPNVDNCYLSNDAMTVDVRNGIKGSAEGQISS